MQDSGFFSIQQKLRLASTRQPLPLHACGDLFRAGKFVIAELLEPVVNAPSGRDCLHPDAAFWNITRHTKEREPRGSHNSFCGFLPHRC